MLHYYLTFSFHLKLALLTQLPTSNERKKPPHLKINPAKFYNGGFTQDLYMHICSISVKFQLWKNSMNAPKSVARTQRVKGLIAKDDPDLFVLKICVSGQGHPNPDYDPMYFSRICVSDQGEIQ